MASQHQIQRGRAALLVTDDEEVGEPRLCLPLLSLHRVDSCRAQTLHRYRLRTYHAAQRASGGRVCPEDLQSSRKARGAWARHRHDERTDAPNLGRLGWIAAGTSARADARHGLVSRHARRPQPLLPRPASSSSPEARGVVIGPAEDAPASVAVIDGPQIAACAAAARLLARRRRAARRRGADRRALRAVCRGAAAARGAARPPVRLPLPRAVGG